MLSFHSLMAAGDLLQELLVQSDVCARLSVVTGLGLAGN